MRPSYPVTCRTEHGNFMWPRHDCRRRSEGRSVTSDRASASVLVTRTITATLPINPHQSLALMSPCLYKHTQGAKKHIDFLHCCPSHTYILDIAHSGPVNTYVFLLFVMFGENIWGARVHCHHLTPCDVSQVLGNGEKVGTVVTYINSGRPLYIGYFICRHRTCLSDIGES